MAKLVCSLLLLASWCVWGALIPKVLIIESYSQHDRWDVDYVKGLRDSIGSNVQLFQFEMDTQRLPVERYQQQALLAWKYYQKIQPALVILGDDNALRFLGRKFLDSQTPVVFLGINNNPREYIDLQRNITGILERPLLKRAIVDIRRIIPKAKRVLVLFDSGTTSQVALDEEFEGRSQIELLGLSITLKFIGDWSIWKQAVLDAKNNYDVLVVGLYHTLWDDLGNNVPADKVMRWTSKNTPIPPFGFWDFAVGKEATIGGLVLSGYQHGKNAGNVAKRILDGESPSLIFPQASDKGYYLFSKTQLAKWHLKLSPFIESQAKFTE